MLLREEGVTFHRLKTWKTSKDPHYAVKKARAGHLYAIAGGEVIPEAGEPEVIFCVDLCRPRDYAGGQGLGLASRDSWMAVARHSYRSSRNASILSVGR
jgi:hypothetical protein